MSPIDCNYDITATTVSISSTKTYSCGNGLSITVGGGSYVVSVTTLPIIPPPYKPALDPSTNWLLVSEVHGRKPVMAERAKMVAHNKHSCPAVTYRQKRRDYLNRNKA